jgi:hypothetical protein
VSGWTPFAATRGGSTRKAAFRASIWSFKAKFKALRRIAWQYWTVEH